jgi:hypothetical protein
MKYGRHWKILCRNDVHPPPIKSATLAPSRKAQVPPHFDMVTQGSDSSQIGRHRKIGIVPSQHRRKPPTLNIDRLVTYLLKLLADSSDRIPASFTFRFAPELKALTIPLGRADVREAKEVKGVRLSYSTTCFSGCNSSANFARRVFKSVKNINASWRCWKPTTVSSA